MICQYIFIPKCCFICTHRNTPRSYCFGIRNDGLESTTETKSNWIPQRLQHQARHQMKASWTISNHFHQQNHEQSPPFQCQLDTVAAPSVFVSTSKNISSISHCPQCAALENCLLENKVICLSEQAQFLYYCIFLHLIKVLCEWIKMLVIIEVY